MKLQTIHGIEDATRFGRRQMLRLGTALLFIVAIMLYASNIRAIGAPVSIELVVAAMIGGYMAMNIGANDVANNVGPAVGSRAMTLTGAIMIAAIFEASGALIAGGDVVGTIKKGIIDPELVPNRDEFIWLMMAALLAGAIWLNVATFVGAPVSTTHSIVGGVLGAGIAAGGWGIANWSTMGAIVASWVISPVIGGAIAALFLFWIKHAITYKQDMLSAARQMVPLLVGLMAWAFSTYLLLKGLNQLVDMSFVSALGAGLGVGAITLLIVRPIVRNFAQARPNDKATVNSMFTLPLIFAAALLSFAHGANDVANAVGPLAAINDAVTSGRVASEVAIPVWVMLVGGLGIALGLALFGPKLIRTVGSEITELDQMRAFCIAMAAAVTVIIASQLALPVSSTHIAVGGIFGVGFLREYKKANYAKVIKQIEAHHRGADQTEVVQFMRKFEGAPFEEKRLMLKQMKKRKANVELTKKERKGLRKVYRQELVKRSALFKIASAWLVTVPVTGFLAAMLFFTIRGMMLPRVVS